MDADRGNSGVRRGGVGRVLGTARSLGLYSNYYPRCGTGFARPWGMVNRLTPVWVEAN